MMVSCGKCLIVASVLVGLLAYSVYTPLPHDGFKNKSTVIFSRSVFRLLELTGNAVAYLGLATEHQFMRSTFDFFLKLQPQLYKDQVQIEEAFFDGVRVLVISPIRAKSSKEALPGIVHYHGGGWVLGSPESATPFTHRVAKELHAVVVTVDYRLAPEHKFPAAIDDCIAATVYFMKNSQKYNVDPNRITVAGDSAGGNLAAAVALKLRDDPNLQPLKAQLLNYPVMQGFDLKLPSYQQDLDGVLSVNRMAYFISCYAVGHDRYKQAVKENRHTSAKAKQTMASSYLNHTIITSKYNTENYTPPKADFGDDQLWSEFKDVLLDPLFSPLLAEDLSNLPPAYVWTGQYDILRDEALLYVERLREAGNSVTHRHYKYGFHALPFFYDQFEEAEEEFNDLLKFMHKNI